MPEDNPKIKKQTNEAPEVAHWSDEHKILATLDQVFSTFRRQLQTQTPRPFTDNGKIAVDAFNDILAGLRFEAPPHAIHDLNGKRLSSAEIELTWKDVAGNADGYRIERCEGYDCQELDEVGRLDVGRIASTDWSFRDSNLSPDTLYRYRVVAFNLRGEAPSKILDVPTSRTYPAKTDLPG